MLKGRDVVIISSVEWDSLWQGAQEIAARLGEAGNRVLYVENTGIRSPAWRDKDRVASRVRRWLNSLVDHGARRTAENVFVCSPLVLPPLGQGWRRGLNRRLFLPSIARTARRLGLCPTLVWVFLPTDTALDLAELLNAPSGTTVYYCVADFSLLSPRPSRLRCCERDLLNRSDLVFAACRQLSDQYSRWNEKVFVFPYGVNLEAFPADDAHPNGHGPQEQSAQAARVETALSRLPRPVIGYVGGLHRFVDYELLTAMARVRPQWSWLFVGPTQAEIGELARLPNVHMLGECPHRQLGDYIRRFDVGIVPYLSSRETATVVPTKINEYLAMGKPVVSTDLPTVREFNDRHQVLFTSAPAPEPFMRAIEEALASPADAVTISRRREVAEMSDWRARLEEMSALIEDADGRRREARPARA